MLNPNFETGLNRDHAINAGVEATYLFSPDTRFFFAYMYEQRQQTISSPGQNNPPFNTAAKLAAYYTANVEDKVNTFMVAVDHTFIPDKFNARVSYTVSNASDTQPIYFLNGTAPGSGAPGSQYPGVKTVWQRVDVTGTYKFDPDLVRRLGWRGDVTAKFQYAWEHNNVANWQNDIMKTYMWATGPGTNLMNSGYMTWLAYDNPNYNVHLVTAALSFSW